MYVKCGVSLPDTFRVFLVPFRLPRVSKRPLSITVPAAKNFSIPTTIYHPSFVFTNLIWSRKILRGDFLTQIHNSSSNINYRIIDMELRYVGGGRGV